MREDDDPNDPMEPMEYNSMLLGQPPGLCLLCGGAPIQTVMYVYNLAGEKSDFHVCNVCYTIFNGVIVSSPQERAEDKVLREESRKELREGMKNLVPMWKGK